MKVNKKTGVRVSTGEQIFYIINNIIMAGLIFITLYPMLYVVFGEILPQAILMYHSKLPAFSAIVGVLAGLFIIYA